MSRTSKVFSYLLTGLLAIGLTALLRAQETSGSITGEVRDTTGAAVPGADVAAVHVATGAIRTTVSAEDGAYVFTSLPIGTYRLTASLPGFKKAVRQGIELHISDRLRVDFALEVGEIAQEISVVADVSQVETETSEKSGLISGEEVRDLQLNGRSFMTLLELLPGVASDMPDRADPNTNPSVSINGARSSASNFNIDGSNNMDIIVGSSALNTFTSVDTIAEFKVITSIAPAEYGKGGFSQVNVVTRGGTKQFRGSFYEFFRNDALDARDYSPLPFSSLRSATRREAARRRPACRASTLFRPPCWRPPFSNGALEFSTSFLQGRSWTSPTSDLTERTCFVR